RRPAGDRERLPRRDPDLLPHDVDSGEHLRHRMLDLEAAVDLDEVRLALEPEEELERSGPLVSHGAARALDGRLHLLAGLGRERRRLLHELLMPALDRAFALAEREDVPVPVAQDLDLDVACRVDDLLEVEGTVAE